MIIRELKLKPNKKQEQMLNEWLWILTGVYNWGLRKIEQDTKDHIYYTRFGFQNLLAGHSKKIGIPNQVIQGVLIQVWISWNRCFKKIAKKPKLKSIRNKFRSIPFTYPIKQSHIKNNIINLCYIKNIKYHKQEIPKGNVKQARIVKRASGWYLILTIDTKYNFEVEKTDKKIGIDTGFKYLAVLSDGTKIENQRNYLKSQKRLGQASRGENKKLIARLHERIKNQRKDYNHKISRKIIEKYSEIYCTNDNLKGQAKKFGKSIGDAGISQLRQFISYKSENHNRKFVLVDSKYTTMTCNKCGARNGPTGVAGLNVRNWECKSCGARLDRDVNAAINILNSGAGFALVSNSDIGFKPKSLTVRFREDHPKRSDDV
jgi:putative transposase